MSPEESVRAGRLNEALQALQARVRDNPGSAKDRLFLFQLLALLGQWDRAATQLKVATDLDASTLITGQLYRRAIDAEQLRAHVFAGNAAPLLLGEPAPWMALLLEGLKLAGQGHFDQAAELRGQALADAPTTAGAVNGERFEWLADADSRIGPCLEIVLDGKYMWVPLDRVRSLKMQPPTDVADVIWTQATCVWTNGGQTPLLVPTRYVGTEAADDDMLRLSRRTDWRQEAGDTYLGVGQRMLTTDAGEYPLLEIREITFDASPAA